MTAGSKDMPHWHVHEDQAMCWGAALCPVQPQSVSVGLSPDPVSSQGPQITWWCSLTT